MINMMYLVLTALLALNISKDMLKAFAKVNNSLKSNLSNINNPIRSFFLTISTLIVSKAFREDLLVNENFFKQPYEIIFRSLSESLRLIGGKYYSVRGKKLDRVIRDYEKRHFFRVTLGGCIIEKVNQTVIISKEL